MIERIIYEADDGTEFDYEEDCLEYEWGLKLGDNVEFALVNHNKTRKLNPKDYKSYEEAWYIFVPNETAFKQLQDAWDGNYIDTCYPPFLWEDVHKYGLWAYDESICREGWYHVGEYLKTVQQEADAVMSIINGGANSSHFFCIICLLTNPPIRCIIGGPPTTQRPGNSIIPQSQQFVKRFCEKSCTNIFSRFCAF